jgi:[acyl-carrier-protein] S-malonyltransferase
MADAARRLALDLEKVELREPRLPVVSNVTAEPTREPAAIRDLLARQVESPVLWERSVRRLVSLGVERFVEPGPGKVLAGLCRKIAPDVPVANFDVPA